MNSPHDFILFDLDGTLSDPLVGVSRSINYALDHFGYKTRPVAEIAQHVGPSLDRAFQAIIAQELDTTALVAKYRERYGAVGYSENVLYLGITEVLATIHAAQVPMGICTAKRQDFAEQILKMFNLSHYFQFISGGEVGISKTQQIESLLSSGQIGKSTVMIGDRATDLIAAHHNELSAGGVLWGYGSATELTDELPLYLFNLPPELSQLVTVG